MRHRLLKAVGIATLACDGYSTSYCVKWMLYENAARTGGVAVKAGTGMDPGYISAYGLEDAFRTCWMNAPATIPIFDNKVSWDIMPGASVARNYGVDDGTAGAFNGAGVEFGIMMFTPPFLKLQRSRNYSS